MREEFVLSLHVVPGVKKDYSEGNVFYVIVYEKVIVSLPYII